MSVPNRGLADVRHALPEAPRERRVDLGASGSLVVRPAARQDVEGLIDLYESLDDSDRHLRFFSPYHPPRSFFERMVTAADRGGCQLVAVVEREGRGCIVGEAGYSVLPHGNGELAITVRKAWRGWLGPFLLDALLDDACRRGIPSLEAQILRSNRAMLGIARARGCMTVSGGPKDWSCTRVAIATKPRSPRRRGSRAPGGMRPLAPAP